MKSKYDKENGIIIGITGGIACGKTTVSRLLAKKGAIPINADEIGHQLLLADSPVIDQLIDTFGVQILEDSGDVSREKLGSIVFKDDKARKKLNNILHPIIIERSRRKARELVSNNPECVVLLDAPLLIEAGAYDSVDLIIVVYTSLEIQLQRIIERSHLLDRPFNREEAQARIDSQMPVSEKVKYADVVIENEGNLSELKNKVDNLWEQIQTSLKNPAGVDSQRLL